MNWFSLTLLTFALGLLSACNDTFSVKPSNIIKGNGSSVVAQTFAGRGYHTGTTLSNGKILIVGGENNDETLTRVELYDPATKTLTEKESLNISRSEHSATLLEDGKVLVTGGYSSDENWDYIDSAEIYDPSLDTWTVVSDLPVARAYHTAIPLSGNRVMLAGGYDFSNDYTNSVHIYDADDDSWFIADVMTYPRSEHTATVLPDGRILVVGGVNNDGILIHNEIYDPVGNDWTDAADTSAAFAYHAAVKLPNNKIMVFGGYDVNWNYSDVVEIYDPDSDDWSAGASLPVATAYIQAGLLANNKVLAVGGYNGDGRSDDLFIYDYLTDTWAASDSLQEARYVHSVNIVNNDLIVAGGYGDNGYIKSIERYSFTSGTWSYEIAPPVKMVSINPPADDNYVDGDILSFSLTFDKAVVLTGEVKVPLSTTNGIIYATASSSGSAVSHTFELLVDSSMLSSGLQIQGPIDLNGGSLIAADGVAGDLEFNSEFFPDVTINYEKPEIISIVPPADGVYYEGYQLEFTVTFSEPVTITGYPYLELDIGGNMTTVTSYTQGSSAVHVFKTYNLSNQTDMDGLSMSGTIQMNGGQILSGTNIPARTSFTAPDVSGIIIPARAAMTFDRSPGSYTPVMLSDNRLLVVGGFDAGTFTATTHVEIFNPISNSWQVLDPLNQSRGLHHIYELPNGNIVVFGGIGANTANPIYDSTEVYDIGANTWTTVMPMSIPRYHPASILMSNGKILVAGGYTTGLACVDSVEIFDPDTNTWTSKAPLASGTQTQMTLVELPDGTIHKSGGGCWGAQRAEETYNPI